MAEQRFPGVTRCLPDLDDRIGDGFPLIVDEEGAPVEFFLAYFLSRQDLAASTQSQYAEALARFGDYLECRGWGSVLDAQPNDLADYRRYRTQKKEGPVSAYSFRVEASALRQFYAWAVRSGRIGKSPVVNLSRNGRSNLSTNRTRHSKIRHVDSFLYDKLLQTASDKAASTRQSPARNVAAIKTLTTVGLRLQEMRCLLTLDIDHSIMLQHGVSVEMEAITKYAINRTVVIPDYALAAVRRYRKTERPQVVHQCQRMLNANLESCFNVTQFDETTRRVSGVWQGRERRYLLHQLPPELRRNAVAVGPSGWVEPLCLYLSQSRGLGMTRSGWEGVFTAISDEMIRENSGEKRVRKVTPHDLRHTFAVNFLRASLAERTRAVADKDLAGSIPLRDPLVDLQELLGHASAVQTLGYLRYVEDLDRLVSAAVPNSEY